MLDWKSNILSPVIVAVLLSIIYWSYDKLEEKTNKFNELVEKHPEIIKDLEEVDRVKNEMQTEYRAFKAKTNFRLTELESKSDVNLKPIKRRLKTDSSDIKIIYDRLNYLKNLH